MSHLYCPKCESIYTGENINRRADTANCDSCGTQAKFSEALKWNQEKKLAEQGYFDSLNEEAIVNLVNEINDYAPIQLVYDKGQITLTHKPKPRTWNFLASLIPPILMIIGPGLVFFIPLLFGIMLGGYGVIVLGGIFFMGIVLVLFRTYKYFLATKISETISLTQKELIVHTKYMLRFSHKAIVTNTLSSVYYSQEFVEEPEESSTKTYQVNVLRIVSQNEKDITCLDKIPVKTIQKIAMLMSYFLKEVNV